MLPWPFRNGNKEIQESNRLIEVKLISSMTVEDYNELKELGWNPGLYYRKHFEPEYQDTDFHSYTSINELRLMDSIRRKEESSHRPYGYDSLSKYDYAIEHVQAKQRGLRCYCVVCLKREADLRYPIPPKGPGAISPMWVRRFLPWPR
jgi:hypothetical protein